MRSLSHADGPLRQLSPRQAELARQIGRAGSYPAIAKAMGLTRYTVESYVKSLALLFDDFGELALPPKQRIWLWVKRLEWELRRPPTVDEIIDASAERENERRNPDDGPSPQSSTTHRRVG